MITKIATKLKNEEVRGGILPHLRLKRDGERRL